jgi:hypothetical protein
MGSFRGTTVQSPSVPSSQTIHVKSAQTNCVSNLLNDKRTQDYLILCLKQPSGGAIFQDSMWYLVQALGRIVNVIYGYNRLMCTNVYLQQRPSTCLSQAHFHLHGQSVWPTFATVTLSDNNEVSLLDSHRNKHLCAVWVMFQKLYGKR